MARSHLRHIVRDATGRAIQNAKVMVYLGGSTSPVADMWDAASGGAATGFLLSNAQGEIEGWLDSPKTVDLSISDNGGTAYVSGTASALLTWTAFTESVEVFPPPAEIPQTDLAQTFSAIQTFGAGAQFKVNPWYDVKAYGAVGNGSTDDSAAIQSAIDAAAAAGGGTVFFGPNIFQVAVSNVLGTGSITVKTGVRLLGAAGAQIRANTSGITVYKGPIVGIGSSTAAATAAGVEGLIVDGQQITHTTSEGIMGIALYNGARDINILNNTIRNLPGDGIDSGQLVASDASNVVVRGNTIHGCAGQAINVQAGTDWIIEGNVLRDQAPTNTIGAESMIHTNSKRLTIANNVIRNWGSITLDFCTDSAITGNVLSPWNGSAGINLNGATRVTCTGNTIDRRTYTTTDIANQACFQVNNVCASLVIANNTMFRKDADRSGILISGTITGITIADNVIDGATVNGPLSIRQPDLLLDANITDLIVVGNTFKATQAPSIGRASGTVTGATIANNVSVGGGYQVLVGSKMVITGNRIYSATTSFVYDGPNVAIFLLDGTNCLVSGNYLESAAGGQAIRLQGVTTGCSGNRVEGNWITTTGNHVQEVNSGVAPNNNVVGLNMTGADAGRYVLIGASSFVGAKYASEIVGRRSDGHGIFYDNVAAGTRPLTLDAANGRVYINPERAAACDPASTDAALVVGARANVPNITVRAHSATPGSCQEWQSSGGTLYSKVDKNGHLMTRKTAAPADADLAAGEIAFWFDSTNGAAKMMFKAKEAGGTVRTGSVNLA